MTEEVNGRYRDRPVCQGCLNSPRLEAEASRIDVREHGAGAQRPYCSRYFGSPKSRHHDLVSDTYTSGRHLSRPHEADAGGGK
jgi:hypothetical protein